MSIFFLALAVRSTDWDTKQFVDLAKRFYLFNYSETEADLDFSTEVLSSRISEAQGVPL